MVPRVQVAVSGEGVSSERAPCAVSAEASSEFPPNPRSESRGLCLSGEREGVQWGELRSQRRFVFRCPVTVSSLPPGSGLSDRDRGTVVCPWSGFCLVWSEGSASASVSLSDFRVCNVRLTMEHLAPVVCCACWRCCLLSAVRCGDDGEAIGTVERRRYRGKANERWWTGGDGGGRVTAHGDRVDGMRRDGSGSGTGAGQGNDNPPKASGIPGRSGGSR